MFSQASRVISQLIKERDAQVRQQHCPRHVQLHHPEQGHSHHEVRDAARYQLLACVGKGFKKSDEEKNGSRQNVRGVNDVR